MSTMMISLEEAARLLGVHPQSLRDQAHRDQTKLGFPVSVIGTRVLIPKRPFYGFLGIDESKEETNVNSHRT